MRVYDFGNRQTIIAVQENNTSTLSFQTGSVMNLDSGKLSIQGGNVGIGIDNPTAKLHVAAATTTAASIRIASSGGTNPTSPQIGDLWFNGTNLYFRKDGTTSVDLLASTGSSVWTDQTTYIEPNTIGTNELRVYDSGGVSIGGTTDPGSYNLNVLGVLSVGDTGTGYIDLTEAYGNPSNGQIGYDGSSDIVMSNSTIYELTIGDTGRCTGYIDLSRLDGDPANIAWGTLSYYQEDTSVLMMDATVANILHVGYDGVGSIDLSAAGNPSLYPYYISSFGQLGYNNGNIVFGGPIQGPLRVVGTDSSSTSYNFVTGSAYGSELITAAEDRDFSSTPNWTGANWARGSGGWAHNVDGANTTTLDNSNLTSNSIIAGHQYRLTFDYHGTISGQITPYIGTAAGPTLDIYAVGENTFVVYITATEDNADLMFVPDATVWVTLDNISLVDINAALVVTNAGYVGIGTTSPTAFLQVAAPTTSAASLRLTASSAVDPSSPNIGDMWFNGTNLNFQKDGSTTVDLLASGASVWDDQTTYIEPNTIGTNELRVYDSGGLTLGATSDPGSGNLGLLNTTNANKVGIIYKNGNPFIHDFNYGNNGSVTTSGYNTFVGLNSGNLTTGSTATETWHASWNTAMGYESLNDITVGAANSAFGAGALGLNTHSSGNSAFGTYALYNSNGGSNNVGIGYWAGGDLTIGSQNIMIGMDAGRVLSTGSNNILIGYDVDTPASDTASFMSIGNLLFATGGFGTGTTVGTGNIGIGTASPSTFKLQVAGDVGPNADDQYDLGSSSYRWQDLYLGPAVCIFNPQQAETGTARNWSFGIQETDGTSEGNLRVMEGANEYLTVSTSGNVGIGATNPTEKLTVQGGNILHTAYGNPTLEATLATSGNSVSVQTSGNYAYLAGQYLSIVDITNPSNPNLETSYDIGSIGGGWINDLFISGNYAYVVDFYTGLVIFDISNPSSPSVVYDSDGAFSGNGIYVSGKYVFIANTDLQIIDISNPSSPILVDTYNLGTTLYDVYVSGRYAYVASGGSGLLVFDISNPSSIEYMDQYNSSGTAYDVYVSGRYAYIADGTYGLHIVDVSNPGSISYVNTYNSSGTAYDVYVSGRYAYIADGTYGLHIVDVSNPSSLSLVGTYNTSDSAQGVYISGKYAYVADDSSGLQIVDINGIETPSLSVGNITTYDITVSNNLSIGNNLNVSNALNIGSGGIYTNGDLTASGDIKTGGGIYLSNVENIDGVVSTGSDQKLAVYESNLYFGKVKVTTDVFDEDLYNFGQNWQTKNGIGTSTTWTGVAISSDGSRQTGIANDKQIYISTDYGNTWAAKDSNRKWSGVAMSADGSRQTAVVGNSSGNVGQIYISTDYGNTWAAKDSNRQWMSVAMSADGSRQTAVVYSGQIYISTDYGNTWAAKDSNRQWSSVAMSADGSRQTAVVYSGQIYISTDYGNTWAAKDSNRQWMSVAMSADGSRQTAVVYSGQIYISTDYGNTWAAKDSNQPWWRVAMSADGKRQTAGMYLGDGHICFHRLRQHMGSNRHR